jgi:hypothetical protein
VVIALALTLVVIEKLPHSGYPGHMSVTLIEQGNPDVHVTCGGATYISVFSAKFGALLTFSVFL